MLKLSWHGPLIMLPIHELKVTLDICFTTTKRNSHYIDYLDNCNTLQLFDIWLKHQYKQGSHVTVLCSPVGGWVCEGAVEGGGLGGRGGGLVAGVLRGARLVLAVRGHGAQPAQPDGEPAQTSQRWGPGQDSLYPHNVETLLQIFNINRWEVNFLTSVTISGGDNLFNWLVYKDP